MTVLSKNESLTKIPVTVVVTVLNEALTIESLLVALAAQTFPPKEIIIVDGGSQDTTVSQIQKYLQEQTLPVVIMIQPGNRSVSRNAGIKAAQHTLIAITDAGCVPHANWLEELVKAWQKTSQVTGTSQPVVVAGYYDANPQTSFEEAVVPYALVMPDRVNPETFLPATRSMLLTKQTWQQAGGFDENLADNEDYAFAQVIKSQAKIVFAREAQVTWQPRSSLRSFLTMIFRFARGDMRAGIIRPKVLLVFGRYLLAAVVIGILWQQQAYALLVSLLILGVTGYSVWAVQKNKRYTPRGWYWLPILQWVADLGVLTGSVVGWWQRYSQ